MDIKTNPALLCYNLYADKIYQNSTVAISHIRAIYGNSAEVDGVTIPIGTSYKDKVMELVSGTR